jgi:hypothetical protein
MTTIANNANKYASEYPLPGGVEQYFDTLVALLSHIRDNNMTPDDLTKWMFDTFPNASGQIAVNGYIAVLSRLRLWSQQDNLIRLTPEGTAVVNKAESAPDEARHRDQVPRLPWLRRAFQAPGRGSAKPRCHP